ncbi:thiamine pyrophosphate-dependent dehydrogenase E1 component subunit alpha [Pseudogracilibacillus sp. SO30301A]|uniref:thiamine pyrophosphate-dependent dehydrogenase E1 component subunit alpha n=1 Tax=Pseudogracilibacillus sp. SO30301A TaxID=3098291 RepID=UPI00300E3715
MIRIRYFEKEVERNMKKGLFHGTTHLCIGQEATAVGVCAMLLEGDKITSTHRGHGHSIAMGADINKMMAEIFGKETGYCKGKGGSMHISDVEAGNLGSNGIVGGSIPIAVGSALTAQLEGKDEVTVCFFGDGATNEGSFHEALNLASIWKLPVVFVCENNEYGMSSPITKMTNINDLSIRAEAYGFPGVTIDGNNLLDVLEEAEKAVQRARNREGPTLIEAKTYRFSGHSKSDKQLYRSAEEVEEWRKKDPIMRLERFLIQTGEIVEKDMFRIKQEIQKDVENATNFALESKEPSMEELFTDVYA